MLLPSPRTWVTPVMVGDTELNLELRDALRFLLDPPAAKAFHSANYSLSNGNTTVAWDSNEYDNDSIHDPSRPTQLYCNTNGLYTIKALFEIDANSTGRREVNIVKNGSTVLAKWTEASPSATVHASGGLAVDELMGVTDFVELVIYQNTGAGLDLLHATASLASSFSMAWIGQG